MLISLIPAFVFFFTFFFYLRTQCASFNINDSGETIMVCDQLSISHSPGYPLHTLWGRVNCLLPLGQPMMRVTFSSMMTAALAVVVVYWILKMLLQRVYQPIESSGSISQQQTTSPWLWELPAVFGALVFAFSYQQWFQAGGAKGGIYTLNTLQTVCMVFLFFKMRENGWFIKAFLLMGFLYGLSLAHHWPNQLVMAPAYLWFFLASQKRAPLGDILRSILRPFDLAEKIGNIISAYGSLNIIRAFTTLLLSLSVYLFLPIRAVQDPIVNWWNPQNYERLWGTVIRKGYLGTGDVKGLVTYARNLNRFWVHAQHQFGGPVVTFLIYGLAVFGFIWLWRKKQWTDALGFFFLGSGVFCGIILFNNPLEGYQWTIDNFFTPVFLMFAIFAAIGVSGLCEWCALNWSSPQIPAMASGVFLGFALMPLTFNYMMKDVLVDGKEIFRSVDQSRYVSSYDYGVNMYKCVSRDAVIICNGDIDILPLWYLQHVEGKRKEVAVFTMQLIAYDWYRERLFKQYPFLAVPTGIDNRPETVVQAMIDQHANDRAFYFTNIFTAQWMQKGNAAIPTGFLWRIVKTKHMNYSFTSAEINNFWDSFRLRNMEPSDRGYWDEYTDVMKDSYGIGFHYTGFFALINKMPDIGIWGFNNALKYRQSQTLSGIYAMLGEAYLSSNNPQAAINNYQNALQRSAQDPHIFARMGDAFFMMKDYSNAQSAYRTALSIFPQESNALAGLAQMEKVAQDKAK